MTEAETAPDALVAFQMVVLSDYEGPTQVHSLQLRRFTDAAPDVVATLATRIDATMNWTCRETGQAQQTQIILYIDDANRDAGTALLVEEVGALLEGWAANRGITCWAQYDRVSAYCDEPTCDVIHELDLHPDRHVEMLTNLLAARVARKKPKELALVVLANDPEESEIVGMVLGQMLNCQDEKDWVPRRRPPGDPIPRQGRRAYRIMVGRYVEKNMKRILLASKA